MLLAGATLRQLVGSEEKLFCETLLATKHAASSQRKATAEADANLS